MIIGPWYLTHCIYDKSGTTIFATTDSRWVVKTNCDEQQSMAELAIILTFFDVRPRHCVSLPVSPYSLYGRTEHMGWYALKRYTAHVSVNTYCIAHWRTLAVHVLQFLQDFHHRQRRIHMDIKKANILYDEATCEFVVADYEHADLPSARFTRDYSDDYKWYYMAMGAELDQPMKAWRLDLVSLGYILGSLTAEPSWTFEKECWGKREGHGVLTDGDLLALRLQELTGVHPLVKTYLDRVATVDWTAVEPPPRSFYVELETVFSG